MVKLDLRAKNIFVMCIKDNISNLTINKEYEVLYANIYSTKKTISVCLSNDLGKPEIYNFIIGEMENTFLHKDKIKEIREIKLKKLLK